MSSWIDRIDARGRAGLGRDNRSLPERDDEAIVFLEQIRSRAVVSQHSQYNLARNAQSSCLDVAIYRTTTRASWSTTRTPIRGVVALTGIPTAAICSSTCAASSTIGRGQRSSAQHGIRTSRSMHPPMIAGGRSIAPRSSTRWRTHRTVTARRLSYALYSRACATSCAAWRAKIARRLPCCGAGSRASPTVPR